MVVVAAFFLAYILLVWFESDAFIWYGRIFRLDTIIPPFHQFLVQREAGDPSSLVSFINMRYGATFFGELLSCPKCLSAWIGGATGFFTLPWTIPIHGWFGALLFASALPYLTFYLFKKIQ